VLGLLRRGEKKISGALVRQTCSSALQRVDRYLVIEGRRDPGAKFAFPRLYFAELLGGAVEVSELDVIPRPHHSPGQDFKLGSAAPF
jgi:hypothetical protein